MKISKRLQAVANLIAPSGSMADIGSDHAMLPLYLLEKRLVSRVVIGELLPAPFKRAQLAVAGSEYAEAAKVLQGDGLTILDPGEVDTVVIAGLGGENIVHILARDVPHSRSFSSYILQPMSRIAIVRRFCAARGWPIKAEKLVYEKQRFFVILKIETGSSPYKLSDLQAETGLHLKLEAPLYRQFLQYKKNKFSRILDNLSVSSDNSSAVDITKRYYRNMVTELERMLTQ